MEKCELINSSMKVCADLIAGQRIAGGGAYEVVWLKDHFVCRQVERGNDDGIRILKIFSQSVNEGLTSTQWDEMRASVKKLVREGVVK